MTQLKFENSFTAFIDILGFRNQYYKRKDICAELLCKFSNFNGEFYSEIKSGNHLIRPNVLCISDSIVISIPLFSTKDHFYKNLLAFFNSITFFNFIALEKGFITRGAVSFGEICHKDSVVLGDALIKAYEQEEKTFYPRIVLTSSFKEQLDKFASSHPYGWNRSELYEKFMIKQDNMDGCYWLDWLNFHVRFPEDSCHENRNHQLLNVIEAKLPVLEHDVCDDKASYQVAWMISYLRNFVNYSRIDLTTQPVLD